MLKKKRKALHKSDRIERNQELVKLADSGIYSITQLAAQFKITRQRASQIYRRITGKKFTAHAKHLKGLREIRKKIEDNKFLANCINCERVILARDHRINRVGQHYLCRECRELGASRRNRKITLQCDLCGKDYHPFFNYKSKKKANNFCTRRCNNIFQGRKQRENKKVTNNPIL